MSLVIYGQWLDCQRQIIDGSLYEMVCLIPFVDSDDTDLQTTTPSDEVKERSLSPVMPVSDDTPCNRGQ